MLFKSIGGRALVTTPAQKLESVSMLNLDEFQNDLSFDDVTHLVANQCDFGASSELLTSWLLFGFTMPQLKGKCTHQKRWVVSTTTGIWELAKHTEKRGTEEVYFADEESKSKEHPPYPEAINRYIAECICTTDPPILTPTTPPPPLNVWEQRAGKEKVVFSQSLRGGTEPAKRDADNKQAVGGLRDAYGAILKLPQTALFGFKLGRSTKLSNSLATRKIQEWPSC